MPRRSKRQESRATCQRTQNTDEQRDIEARIDELEKILKNVEVVVEEEVDLEKINVGCTVLVHDDEFDEEIEFKIVGSTEANSLQGKISNESPVGQALMGKKVGDVVDVETPAGNIRYTVLKIGTGEHICLTEKRSEKSGRTAEECAGSGSESA